MISAFLAFLSFLGILDSLYLTWEHVSGAIPPCGVGIFADCGKVLKSPYAMVFGIPLSVYGLGFYILEFFLALWSWKSFLAKKFLTITTAFGFLFSLYLVSLMVFVIQALCLYCLLSALISTVLFFIVQIVFWRARKAVIVGMLSVVYPRFIRPILFHIDSEAIHVATVKFSGFIGSVPLLRWIVAFFLSYRDKHLEQTLAGIRFPAPVGLAAGYDYEADLT
ncbi:MAG: hypothetical protein N3A54_07025, partial [Patescibacteria group bacterium]|nr:hypothetical protein [Patescibacteria group bacterium]